MEVNPCKDEQSGVVARGVVARGVVAREVVAREVVAREVVAVYVNMDAGAKLGLVRRRAKALGLSETIDPSQAKGKKYQVEVGGKRIHFGQAGASDFIEHRDEARRQRYLARARQIRNKRGRLTCNDKTSANFWSIHVLW
jgi:hypothetical protein